MAQSRETLRSRVFGGPVGAGASLIYFGGKAIYNYYNPNNPAFAVPKN